AVAKAERSVKISKALPDLSVGYFNQSFIGSATSDGGVATGSDRFSGVTVGVAVPLIFGSQVADVKSARIKEQMVSTNNSYYRKVIESELARQQQAVQMYAKNLEYYRDSGLPQAEFIIDNARKSFENGAIDYVEYFQGLDQALKVKFNHLIALNEYNQSVIGLEYLIGQ
ncbi:MAG: TolC family protein, partial [Flavobacteriales bacterium]